MLTGRARTDDGEENFIILRLGLLTTDYIILSETSIQTDSSTRTGAVNHLNFLEDEIPKHEKSCLVFLRVKRQTDKSTRYPQLHDAPSNGTGTQENFANFAQPED